MTRTIEVNALSYTLFINKKNAPLWLLIRLYVGWEWLSAGWEKIVEPSWFGSSAGSSITSFVQGALAKTGGAHPSVQGWYAAFLQGCVLPNAVFWSNAIAVGEVLVGLGLILGVLTGIAAFFGFFMNLNYLFAGTVSTNPQLLILGLFLILAWRVAGYWGGDYYVLPWFRKLSFFRKRPVHNYS